VKRVLVEVVAPMLSSTEMGCRGCGAVMGSLGLKDRDRKNCTDEYPDDWKFAVGSLSEWMSELFRLYRHRIEIRIIDAQSPAGLWKQLRHRVFKFPAFIVDNKRTYVGWNYADLEAIIDDSMKDQAPSV
jgi:hypothetical protein